MNASRLRELVQLMINTEASLGIGAALANTATSIDQLVQSPSNPNLQQQVVSSLNTFEEKLLQAEASFNPAQVSAIAELGAATYFSSGMATALRESLRDNGMTPTAVRELAQYLASTRHVYIQKLTQLEAGLDGVGIEVLELEPGEVEVGFTLPRQLFHNELGGFAKELNEIRLVVRAFSELALGSPEPLELRTISTTDPLIYIALAAPTIKVITETFAWALDSWKKIEEIRKVRADVKKLQALPEPNRVIMVEQLDQNIKASVEALVRSRVDEMLAEYNHSDVQRRNELKVHLERAVESVVARVERGVTIEVRQLPPVGMPASDDPAEVQAHNKRVAQFHEIERLSKQLSFGPPTHEPILRLPGAGTGADGDV